MNTIAYILGRICGWIHNQWLWIGALYRANSYTQRDIEDAHVQLVVEWMSTSRAIPEEQRAATISDYIAGYREYRRKHTEEQQR